MQNPAMVHCLFFRVDELDGLLERARTIVTAVDEEVHGEPEPEVQGDRSA
jgi:hypothetical protein